MVDTDWVDENVCIVFIQNSLILLCIARTSSETPLFSIFIVWTWLLHEISSSPPFRFRSILLYHKMLTAEHITSHTYLRINICNINKSCHLESIRATVFADTFSKMRAHSNWIVHNELVGWFVGKMVNAMTTDVTELRY